MRDPSWMRAEIVHLRSEIEQLRGSTVAAPVLCHDGQAWTGGFCDEDLCDGSGWIEVDPDEHPGGGVNPCPCRSSA